MASDKNRKTSVRRVSKTIALTIAVVVFGCIAMFTTIVAMANASSLRESRAEYDLLREFANDIATASDDYDIVEKSALDEEMRQMNPDYICWLRVDGTGIDYPVVRGYDNEKYISTSFYGEKNLAGTLFMDYRNVGELFSQSAEDALPHIIIYGHNLQQGGMFGNLRMFLNSQFFEENRRITLTVDDQDIEFEIFSARRSDINDPAYFLNFSEPHYFPRFADKIDAPLSATQIITLSTCASGGGNDARIIIQGYRLFD